MILSFFAASFVIFGIWISTDEDMIFYKMHEIPLPKWIQKPLFDCPVCMASIWGNLVYFAFIYLGYYDYNWIRHIIYWLSLTGFNFIVLQFIQGINIKIDIKSE